MTDRIRHLMEQIDTLEAELNKALQEKQIHLNFTIQGKRIKFEKSIIEAHKNLKIGLIKWLGNRPLNLITAPIIYGMIFPMLVLDLCITFYQMTCFPIYGIKKANRGDYMIFDRQHLSFLNFIEKFHCTYCAYGNGLIAYATEVLARTEQYFCPIKHARKMLGTHARYKQFIEYGDANEYQKRLEEFRNSLGN